MLSLYVAKTDKKQDFVRALETADNKKLTRGYQRGQNGHNLYWILRFGQLLLLVYTGGLTDSMCGAQTCTHLYSMNLQHAHLQSGKHIWIKASACLFFLSFQTTDGGTGRFLQHSSSRLDFLHFKCVHIEENIFIFSLLRTFCANPLLHWCKYCLF